MDGNSSNKDESTSSSLMELLKKYTTRIDERETLVKESTRPTRPQQKTSTDEVEKCKDLVNKSQSNISDSNQPIDEQTTNINYKTKWEESEVKYRQLEKKYRQLENGTIKQLQDKVDLLQRDYHQMKLIKDRITEICSCRQLTTNQFEELKSLVNNNTLSNEIIANKNDFHQQTIKLRSILLKHNDELLTKLDEMLKKKRKRDQYEDDLSDDNNNNNSN